MWQAALARGGRGRYRSAALFAGTVLILGTIAAGVGWSSLPHAGGDAESPAARPQQGEAAAPAAPRTLVAALGRIEPRSQIVNVSAPGPDRLARLLVRKGEWVTRGQTLCVLESQDERAARRDEIRARLAEARTQLEAETALGAARIRAATVRLAEIRELMPLKIAAQAANVSRLEAELANSRDIYGAQETLKSRDFVSRRAFEDQRTAVLRDEASLRAARAALDELKRQLELDRAVAEALLEQEKAALAHARAAIPVESLASELALAEMRVRQSAIAAPIDGRILNILTWPGEPVANQPILVMGDTARMHAVAEVYETDVAAIRLGQTAVVSSPALPAPLTGHVVEIGSMIFKNDVLDADPAARTDARVVEVRVEIDDGAAVERLTRLTVDIVIDVAPAGDPTTDRPMARR